VFDRTGDLPTLVPGAHIDLLFECSESVKSTQLFPSNFSVAVLQDDPLIDAGYLVVELGSSLSEAGDALLRLSSSWWELSQATSVLVTLVFVTSLPVSSENSEKDFALQHRRLAFQAPAPLIFGASWEGAGDADDYDYDYEDDEYDEYGEEKLFEDVCGFLKNGPREVQELASNFAMRFNGAVRANPNNSYSADKKNDGSFKKWLVARGIQMGDVYDRNKCNATLPANLRKAKGKGEKGKEGKTEKEGK